MSAAVMWWWMANGECMEQGQRTPFSRSYPALGVCLERTVQFTSKILFLNKFSYKSYDKFRNIFLIL